MAGRWMSPAEISGAMWEMFSKRPDSDRLSITLSECVSWTQYRGRFCTHPTLRANWLVAKMGL
jgi:hypothetical protein